MSGFDARVAAFSLSLLQRGLYEGGLLCHSHVFKSTSSVSLFKSQQTSVCLSLPKTPNANICFSSLLTCADADIFLWCISEGPLYIALALSYELLNTLYT